MLNLNEIIQGSALDVLKQLDSDSIDCCITSPPYYNLRNYHVDGQLGNESTFHEYLDKLIEIFAEVKRVIKPAGSIWINLGDSYNKNKSLIGIPERFAIHMTDELGLVRRNTIIWFKGNCMPSSARDRFTVDFEYCYFFTKSPRYFFETQYEQYTDEPKKRGRWNDGGLAKSPQFRSKFDNRSGIIFGGNKRAETDPRFSSSRTYSGKEWNPSRLGRLKRCVWKIPTKAYSGAHFATFPPRLIEPMIKSSCPEFICNSCGKPRNHLLKFSGQYQPFERWGKDNDPKGRCNAYGLSPSSGLRTTKNKIYESDGLSDCGCNAGFQGGIVLDPFIGSGTTGLVALQNGRRFVGIELNEDYIKLAMQRLEPYINQTVLDKVILS